MKRIILAGLLGGIVMFILSAVMHMFTPIGAAGLQNLPNEDAVTSALKANIPNPGLYFFPGMNMDGSESEQKAWMEKCKIGPVGLLVYNPVGEEPLSAKLMLTELCTNILSALLAAFVLATSSARFWGKVILVTALGLIAWVSIDLSYWNWYKFPGSFILAEGFDQMVSFFGAGVMIAWMQRTR